MEFLHTLFRAWYLGMEILGIMRQMTRLMVNSRTIPTRLHLLSGRAMSRAVLTGLLLLGVCFIGGSARAGQDPKPFSKNELMSSIKRAESGPQEISQGDLAVQVQRRGLDFAVDDRGLDEFRQVGARLFLLNAIKHARVEEASRSRTERPQSDQDDPDSPEARRRAEMEALAK